MSNRHCFCPLSMLPPLTNYRGSIDYLSFTLDVNPTTMKECGVVRVYHRWTPCFCCRNRSPFFPHRHKKSTKPSLVRKAFHNGIPRQPKDTSNRFNCRDLSGFHYINYPPNKRKKKHHSQIRVPVKNFVVCRPFLSASGVARR